MIFTGLILLPLFFLRGLNLITLREIVFCQRSCFEEVRRGLFDLNHFIESFTQFMHCLCVESSDFAETLFYKANILFFINFLKR